jgi:hypothetical protein
MSEGIAAEALERYEAAQRRAVAAREAWESSGAQFTHMHSNKTEGVHPLLKALIESEAHADRLMKSLSHKQARAGRPTGTGSAPDRLKRPKLKAVG